MHDADWQPQSISASHPGILGLTPAPWFGKRHVHRGVSFRETNHKVFVMLSWCNLLYYISTMIYDLIFYLLYLFIHSIVDFIHVLNDHMHKWRLWLKHNNLYPETDFTMTIWSLTFACGHLCACFCLLETDSMRVVPGPKAHKCGLCSQPEWHLPKNTRAGRFTNRERGQVVDVWASVEVVENYYCLQHPPTAWLGGLRGLSTSTC